MGVFNVFYIVKMVPNCVMLDLWKKDSCKIHALAKITPYMNLLKGRLLMNAIFASQCNHCPLVWIYYNRKNDNKINRLHDRCLRITYHDKQSSLEQLLEKDRSAFIHNRNLQKYTTVMRSTKQVKVYHHQSWHNYSNQEISILAISDVFPNLTLPQWMLLGSE